MPLFPSVSKGDLATYRKQFKKSLPLYLLLLPSLVLLLVFSYYPMYGLVIAFKDYSPSLGFS